MNTPLSDADILEIVRDEMTLYDDGASLIDRPLMLAVARALLAAAPSPTSPGHGDGASDEAIEKVRELRDIQADSVGTDPYMRGLYNGLELAVAVVEDRDPVYVEAHAAPHQTAGDAPASEYLAKVYADPRRAAALDRARNKAGDMRNSSAEGAANGAIVRAYESAQCETMPPMSSEGQRFWWFTKGWQARAALSAQAPEPDALHQQIMNLPCKLTTITHPDNVRWYREGHRDARHAAAELVAAMASHAKGGAE